LKFRIKRPISEKIRDMFFLPTPVVNEGAVESQKIFPDTPRGKLRPRYDQWEVNMKNIFSILIALSMSIGFAGVSLAQTSKIKERQKNQQTRILKGVKSGELTAKETLRLEKEQLRIQKDKKDAKADGNVTKKERAKITVDQLKASAHIFRAKHNKKDRN
jgi:hypothetical protein